MHPTTLNVDGLYVETRGSGDPPVVLIHGLGAHSHSWREWMPGLTASHRTYAVDLAGFGRSPLPSSTEDLGPRAQAARVTALIRSLDGPPPVLVGHSLGAGIAALSALRLRDEDPNRSPPALVLVSGAVYAQALPPFLKLARLPVIGDLMLLPPPPRSIFRWGIREIVHDPDTVDSEMVEGYRGPLMSLGRRRAILRSARQLDLAQAEPLARRLPELDLPVLLVWGEEDPIIPVESGRRLAGDLPRAELVTLSGVGHLPPEEAPDRSLDPVLTFLADPGRIEGARERS